MAIEEDQREAGTKHSPLLHAWLDDLALRMKTDPPTTNTSTTSKNTPRDHQPTSPNSDSSNSNSLPSSPTDSTDSVIPDSISSDVLDVLDSLELEGCKASTPNKRSIKYDSESDEEMTDAAGLYRGIKRRKLNPPHDEDDDDLMSDEEMDIPLNYDAEGSDSEPEERDSSCSPLIPFSLSRREFSTDIMNEVLTLETVSPIRSESDSFLEAAYAEVTAASPPSPPNNDLVPDSEEVETRTGVSFSSGASDCESSNQILNLSPTDYHQSQSYHVRNHYRSYYMNMFENDLKRIDDVERTVSRFCLLKNSVNKLRNEIREDKKRRKELLGLSSGASSPSFLSDSSDSSLPPRPGTPFAGATARPGTPFAGAPARPGTPFAGANARSGTPFAGDRSSSSNFQGVGCSSYDYSGYNGAFTSSSSQFCSFSDMQNNMYAMNNRQNTSSSSYSSNMYSSDKTGYQQFTPSSGYYNYYNPYMNSNNSGSICPQSTSTSTPVSNTPTTSQANEDAQGSTSNITCNYDTLLEIIDKQIYKNDSRPNNINNHNAGNRLCNNSISSYYNIYNYNNDDFGTSYSNACMNQPYGNYYNGNAFSNYQQQPLANNLSQFNQHTPSNNQETHNTFESRDDLSMIAQQYKDNIMPKQPPESTSSVHSEESNLIKSPDTSPPPQENSEGVSQEASSSGSLQSSLCGRFSLLSNRGYHNVVYNSLIASLES